MASTGQLALPDQVRRMVAQSKQLLNDRLRSILRIEALPVSGVKSELQSRLIRHIENFSNAGDIAGVNRLYNLIYTPRGDLDYSRSNGTNTPPSSLSPHHPAPLPRPSYGSGYGMSSHQSQSARESTRDTVTINVTLTADVVDQLQNDQNLRVMVFCAADTSNPPFVHSEITFPHQVELKCNLDEVKANLRGLKNKPGSTRPADITSFIRKKAGYPNNVAMTYALTQKAIPARQKFFLVVNLVHKRPVDELVARLRKGKVISKERVIQEMTNKAQDTDIVATSTVMSLKCPLSTLRIDTPCRSMGCAHNQCFDATSYLQLQEQAPTWTCPVCNKFSPFESLTIDLYVDDILKATSRSLDQVTIEPNGSWSKHSTSEDSRRGNPTPDDDDDDDEDLIEIPDTRVASLRHEPNFSSPTTQTPPMSSREASLASSVPRSNKRPASEVIDLTLSDDDEAPMAKIKRSSTSTDPLRSRYHDGISFNLPRPPPLSYSADYFNTAL